MTYSFQQLQNIKYTQAWNFMCICLYTAAVIMTLYTHLACFFVQRCCRWGRVWYQNKFPRFFFLNMFSNLHYTQQFWRYEIVKITRYMLYWSHTHVVLLIPTWMRRIRPLFPVHLLNIYLTTEIINNTNSNTVSIETPIHSPICPPRSLTSLFHWEKTRQYYTYVIKVKNDYYISYNK